MIDEIFFEVAGTHRSRSNCIGSCASDPSGNPLCIGMSPRRAALYRRSPKPPGSEKWYGKRPVDRKRRRPMNAAPSSLVYLARQSCNEREEISLETFQHQSKNVVMWQTQYFFFDKFFKSRAQFLIYFLVQFYLSTLFTFYTHFFYLCNILYNI